MQPGWRWRRGGSGDARLQTPRLPHTRPRRARATLGPQHAAKLEAALQDLAPYFDWAAAQAAPSVGEEEGRRVEACGAALAGAYRPLAALVKRSQRKAQEFAASMPPPPAPGASSAAPGASPGAASSQAAQGAAGDAAGGAAGDAAGDAGADSAAAAEAEAAAREEAEEQLQLVQAWLHAVHAAAVRALAEAAAGHLDACLGHARSLSAPARSARRALACTAAVGAARLLMVPCPWTTLDSMVVNGG